MIPNCFHHRATRQHALQKKIPLRFPICVRPIFSSTCRQTFSATNGIQAPTSSRRLGKSRLAREQQLREFVLAGLKQEWSPREIGERLKKEYPQDMTMRMFHEAIYRYIYVLPRG